MTADRSQGDPLMTHKSTLKTWCACSFLLLAMNLIWDCAATMLLGDPTVGARADLFLELLYGFWVCGAFALALFAQRGRFYTLAFVYLAILGILLASLVVGLSGVSDYSPPLPVKAAHWGILLAYCLCVITTVLASGTENGK